MSVKITSGFELVHDLIKLRWIPEILKSISLGNASYTSILESIPYLSHTELNRKLNILIDQDVINKDFQGSSPNYSLNNFGEDLVHIFYHLEDLEERYSKRA